MSDWTTKEISLDELSRLYQDLAGEWLLMEILATDEGNIPLALKLHMHHPEKDKLHEFMSEHDGWAWNKKYLILYADPTKPCDIKLSA
jgi:hypothetical protein